MNTIPMQHDWWIRLPLPLARLKALYEAEEDEFRLKHRLKDLFETLIRFAAVISIQDSYQKSYDNSVFRQMAKTLQRPGNRSWINYMKASWEEPMEEDSPRIRIKEWWNSRLSEIIKDSSGRSYTTVSSAIEMLIGMRDKIIGHGTTGAIEELDLEVPAKLMDECLLRFVEMTDGWRLMVLTDGKEIPQWLDATGMRLIESEEQVQCIKKNHPLWISDSGRVIDLYPLFLFKACGGDRCSHESTFFFYEDMRKKSCIAFLDYVFGHRAFLNDEDAYQVSELFPVVSSGESSIEAYKTSLLQFFVGRQDDISRIMEYIHGNKSGIIFLSGSPGVGKSAIMAQLHTELENREIPAHLHFIRRDTSDTMRAETFLAHLMDFFNGFAVHENPPARNNAEALANTVRWQLMRYGEGHGSKGSKVLILVDGLDEALPDKDILDHIAGMPDTPGVVWLLAGRGGNRIIRDWLDNLDQKRPQSPVINYNLGPLCKDDVRSLLSRIISNYELQENDVDEVYSRSEGNSLYLIYLISLFQTGEINQTELKTLPRGLEALYEKIFGSYQEGHMNIILLLAVSFESLPIGTIANVLEINPMRVSAALRDCGELVVEDPSTPDVDDYTLFHQSVRDYLESYDARNKTQMLYDAERRLTEFCLKQEISEIDDRDYELIHTSRHLYRLSGSDPLCQDIAGRGTKIKEREHYHKRLFDLMDGEWLSRKIEILGPSAAAKDLGLTVMSCINKAESSAEDAARLVRYLLKEDNLGQEDLNLVRCGLFGLKTILVSSDNDRIGRVLDHVEYFNDVRIRAMAYAQIALFMHKRNSQIAQIALEHLKTLIGNGNIGGLGEIAEAIVSIDPGLAVLIVRQINNLQEKMRTIINIGKVIKYREEPHLLSCLYEIGSEMLPKIENDCYRLSYNARLISVFKPEDLTKKLEEVRMHLQDEVNEFEMYPNDHRKIIESHAQMVSSLWPVMDSMERMEIVDKLLGHARNLQGIFHSHETILIMISALADNIPEWAGNLMHSFGKSWHGSNIAVILAHKAFGRGDIAAINECLQWAVYAPSNASIQSLLTQQILTEDSSDSYEKAKIHFERGKSCACIASLTGGIASMMARVAASLDPNQVNAISLLLDKAKKEAELLPTEGDKARAWRDIAVALSRIDMNAALAMMHELPIDSERDEGFLYLAKLNSEVDPDRAIEISNIIKDRAMHSFAIASILSGAILADLTVIEKYAAEISDSRELARAIRDAAITLARHGRGKAALEVVKKINEKEYPVEAVGALWSISLAEQVEGDVRSTAEDLAVKIQHDLSGDSLNAVKKVKAIQMIHHDLDKAREIIYTLDQNHVPGALITLAANCGLEGASDIVPPSRWSLSDLTGTMGRPYVLSIGDVSQSACVKAQEFLSDAIARAKQLQFPSDVLRALWISFKVYLAEGSKDSLIKAATIAINTNEVIIFMLPDLASWYVRHHSSPEAIQMLADAIVGGFTQEKTYES